MDEKTKQKLASLMIKPIRCGGLDYCSSCGSAKYRHEVCKCQTLSSVNQSLKSEP